MRPDFGKTAYEAARAKINASLDVLGLMTDGYHELDSVMVSVSLCDDVSVTLRESDETGVSVCVSGLSKGVPQNAANTAAKAALQYFEVLGVSKATAEIEIRKRIPVGAGLGGGSADAAAVLRALNTLYGNVLSREKLRDIGLAVGADVPFCIDGGTARAGGRGELLSALSDFPNCEIVIAKPAFSISTAELYSKIDSVKITARPDTNGLCAAIENGDLRGAAHRCFNVFEQALTPDMLDTVTAIESTLLEQGALCAVMTGTGSAVFGIFEEPLRAANAQNALADITSFICEPEK